MNAFIPRIVLCLGLLPLLACGTPATRDVPLRVVSDLANPPFSSWDEAGRPVGIEVEVLERLGRKLGRPVTWTELPFVDLMPAVARGDADVACSTIGITDERALTVAFSQSYHRTRIVVVVRRGDDEPKELAALVNRRVGAGRGTTAETAIVESLPDSVLVFERDGDLTFVEMLDRGSIDALVMDEPAADRFIAESTTLLMKLDEDLGAEHYGFAVGREARALRETLDSVLAELRDSRQLETWAREHGL